MSNMKSSFIISYGVWTRFKHLLACTKMFESQWYYNKIEFASILGVAISFSLFTIQYVYTIRIGHVNVCKELQRI
jgi:hypothetical protein